MKPYNTEADSIVENCVLQALLTRRKGGIGKKELGTAGECLAAKHLVSNGYTILEKNYRTRYGEIDLIASRNGAIFFIEVKTRRSTSCGFAEEAVNRIKIKKIVDTARRYIAENRRFAGWDVFFTLAAIQISGTKVDFKILPMV